MFIERSEQQLRELMSRPLADLRLAVLMLDGIELHGRTNIVGLGITTDGDKLALGLWDGSTENATVAAAAGRSRSRAAARRPTAGRPRRAGGCMITGNEDGAKHCAMNILYSLQHLGYVIPPQADSGWLGEAGPGPSYLDPGSGGPENDFTNRNTTFLAWNLMHVARMLKDAGGIPAHGNQKSLWDAGCRFDFANPDYR